MLTTRREFIAASAATVLAARAVGQSTNERLGLGLIGCGNRGNTLLSECLALRAEHNLDVVALCDVWKVNRESTAARVAKETGVAPKTFARYAELLALPEVDAVIIATPDFAHSPILIDAARVGKNAYVEKPMATQIEDANAAVEAVEASGIVCQAGTQFRSGGTYRAGAKLIQSGALGALIKCQATYVRNEPSWQRSFDNVRAEDVDWEQFLMGLPPQPFDARRFRCWHLYKSQTNGLVGLLGAHPIDVALWYSQDPLPVSAVGMGAKRVWTDRETDDTQECLFTYPKGHLLQFTGRLGNSNGGPQNVFYGSRGTFDTTSWTAVGDGEAPDRIQEPIKVEAETGPGHMANWLECIRTKNRATYADVHAGYAHSIAAIMGAMACDTGKRVLYDATTRTIKEG
jgi:predicted dehydrogenase